MRGVLMSTLILPYEPYRTSVKIKMCKFNISASIIFLLGVLLDNTQSAWLRCYKSSLSNYTVVPLSNPTPLLTDSCFDPNLKTMIYTFGFRGKCNGPATTAVLQTYINMNKRNVLLLDWEEESRSDFLSISVGYALLVVPKAKNVGQIFGEALMILARSGLNMNQVHLIGHSLGAHVLAYAGRWTRQRGQPVARITGLDPARALFEGTFAIHNGLDRTCATFVDIIHTNPGYYGISKSSGTVDLWPNYSSDGMQPGCPKGAYQLFTSGDLCSHDRAWHYFIESIGSPTAFPAVAAANYNTWLDLLTPPNITIFMGELTNTRTYGNYFLTTQGQSPYSKGSLGMMPDAQTRRRRNSPRSLSDLFGFLSTFEESWPP